MQTNLKMFWRHQENFPNMISKLKGEVGFKYKCGSSMCIYVAFQLRFEFWGGALNGPKTTLQRTTRDFSYKKMGSTTLYSQQEVRVKQKKKTVICRLKPKTTYLLILVQFNSWQNSSSTKETPSFIQFKLCQNRDQVRPGVMHIRHPGPFWFMYMAFLPQFGYNLFWFETITGDL